MGLELGVLLADDRSFPRALEAILALTVEPDDARLFLMDDGVRADPVQLAKLIEMGVEVTACAGDAEARGLSPVDGGPRFGSQHDHAVMMRDARRIIAITGAAARDGGARSAVQLDDHRPPASVARRTIAVRLTRGPRDPKTAQALRSAVGYAACDLDVVIAAEPPAAALLDRPSGDLPQPVLRALGTLRGLGHRIAPAADAPPAHVQVTW